MGSQQMMLTSDASGRINALFSLPSLRSMSMVINAFVMLLLLPFRVKWNPKSSSLDEDNKKYGNGGSVVRLPPTMMALWWKRASGAVIAAVDQEVATRRAIAINRVKEEEDNVGCIRDYSLFGNSRGDTLFTQSWTPASVRIRRILSGSSSISISWSPLEETGIMNMILDICIGYFALGNNCPANVLQGGSRSYAWAKRALALQNSGRYSDFAKLLNANGFKVYGMDWIGHGGSDGQHAFVHSLDDPVRDFKSYIEKIEADNPGLPCFCFGHSTGAAIILKAVLDPKIQARISGIALTSPAVGVQPTHSFFVVIAPLIAFLIPRYQISGAQKGMPVSRDPEALIAKYSDPLVYTGAIRVRTGYEILRITSYLQENLKRVKVPFLVLHGTADNVTDPAASQKLYEEASSSDKTLKLFEGFLHDLLFEPERKDIANHIIQWFTRRLQGS
ncbi:hypothetical protein ACFE04_004896 [Oxalis oulophora]